MAAASADNTVSRSRIWMPLMSASPRGIRCVHLYVSVCMPGSSSGYGMHPVAINSRVLCPVVAAYSTMH
jgi:hypothetical protein